MERTTGFTRRGKGGEREKRETGRDRARPVCACPQTTPRLLTEDLGAKATTSLGNECGTRKEVGWELGVPSCMWVRRSERYLLI